MSAPLATCCLGEEGGEVEVEESIRGHVKWGEGGGGRGPDVVRSGREAVTT